MIPWRITCIFLAFSCLIGLTHSINFRSKGKSRDKVSGAGSGGWALSYSDDEDLTDLSGSGSGMSWTGNEDDKTKLTSVTLTRTTTDRPLTDCEKSRETSQTVRGRYAPRCLSNGDFDSLQCHGYPGTSECWCSDHKGIEIPGTLMEPPNYPSCNDGNNLPPCVYQLVKHLRNRLPISYPPSCDLDGQFDQVQCQGSICFCVDESTGRRVHGSEVHNTKRPNCGSDSSDVQAPTTKNSAEGKLGIHREDKIKHSTPKVDVNFDSGEHDDKDDDQNAENDRGGNKVKEDNKTEKERDKVHKPGNDPDKVEKASDIISQPGILAGIIGGSVVLLLCLVLLVMFLIYRMRKKDEGSYPLDEPRKLPNYNYVRAPEKEIYA